MLFVCISLISSEFFLKHLIISTESPNDDQKISRKKKRAGDFSHPVGWMTTTTAATQEMEEWKGGSNNNINIHTKISDLESAPDDDETLLAEGEDRDFEFDFERRSVSDNSSEDGDGDGTSEDERNLSGGRRRSYKSSLWVVLSTLATLAGRRVLTSGFREFALFCSSL